MKAKFYYLLLPAIFLTACASHHAYSVEAYSSKGRLLSKRADLDSNKEGIEMARQTLCKTYPNAIIKVTNNVTGKEIERKSCR